VGELENICAGIVPLACSGGVRRTIDDARNTGPVIDTACIAD
jgi:hypothetical protein